jgi:hypothetical protein
MLAAARKAGQHVSGAIVQDGRIELRFGKPGESAAARGNGCDTDAELEEFEARHGQA